MGNHTHAATTSGPTPPASPAPRPAQVLALVLLLGLLLGPTGCGATGPTAPSSPTPTAAPTTPSTTTTSPTTGTTTGPPAMPDTARQHTTAGAKAFVRYYVEAITYAEGTLDTTTVKKLSMPTCSGCAGGIHGLRKIARHGGHITGASLSVSNLRSEEIDDHGVVTLAFDLANTAEHIQTPGKPTVLHPAGKHPMIMTLVARHGGWIVGEYREQ